MLSYFTDSWIKKLPEITIPYTHLRARRENEYMRLCFPQDFLEMDLTMTFDNFWRTHEGVCTT
jgi:hypothetical protein